MFMRRDKRYTKQPFHYLFRMRPTDIPRTIAPPKWNGNCWPENYCSVHSIPQPLMGWKDAPRHNRLAITDLLLIPTTLHWTESTWLRFQTKAGWKNDTTKLAFKTAFKTGMKIIINIRNINLITYVGTRWPRPMLTFRTVWRRICKQKWPQLGSPAPRMW